MKRFLLLLLCTASYGAAEEAPWIDTVLQPVLNVSGTYQNFTHLNSGNKICPYPGQDALLDAGLFFALSPETCVDFEMRVTRTHAHSWAIDQFRQSARFMLSDDAEGDPFASSVGISIMEPLTTGLHDPSVIHHSHLEMELHYAIGQECSVGPDWIYRTYALAAIGMGGFGYPWLRCKIATMKNIDDIHFFQICLEGRKGFGHNNLNPHHFHGYGKIDYACIDAKIGYSYQSLCGWTFSFDYLRRLFSYNTPYQINQFILSLDYPLSF